MSQQEDGLLVVCPGTRLGPATELQPGHGTYVLGNFIYASVAGILQRSENTVSVISPKSVSIVPENGAIVTGRVTRINMRMATVEILCVGNKPVQSPLTGIIRARDVRAFDVDNVEIYKCFRPGDIVRAVVLSRGDARNYYLSTAKNELGVIAAVGRAGVLMVPISWEQMQCPITKAKEFRKVAKQLFVKDLDPDQVRQITESQDGDDQAEQNDDDGDGDNDDEADEQNEGDEPADDD